MTDHDKTKEQLIAELALLRQRVTELERLVACEPGDEPKRIQTELQETVRFQARLLEEMAQAVIAIDLAGEIVYWNRYAETVYGWPATEAIGRNIKEMIIPKVSRQQAVEVMTGLKVGQSWSGEFLAQRRDGSTFLAWVTNTPIYDDTGQLMGVLGVSTDITERKRAEETLRRQYSFVAAVIDTAGAPIIVLDTKGRIIRFNHACEELTGYSFDELRGKRIWHLLSEPEEIAPFKTVLEKLQVDHLPDKQEGYWLTKTGERRPISWTITTLSDLDGLTEYIIATGTDITQFRRSEAELKKYRDHLEELVTERTAELQAGNKQLQQKIEERQQVQEALRETQSFLQSILDALPSHLIILDEAGIIIAINAAWHRFSEANPLVNGAYGLGTDYLEICERAGENGVKEGSVAAAGIRAVIARQSPEFWLEYACHTPTTKGWFMMRVTRFEMDGQVRVIVSHENITERRQAEEALARSEVRFRTMVQNSSDIFTMLDAEGTILYESPSIKRILGYKPEDLVGQNAFNYIHPEDVRLVQSAFTDHLQQPEVNYPVEFRFRHANGKWVYLEALGNNSLADPRVKSVVINSRDITERKQAEIERENLLTAEREQRLLAETLAEVVLALTAQTSLEAVLDEILKQVQRVVPYNTANITLLEGETLRVVRWRGYELFNSETFVANLAQPLTELLLDTQIIQSQQSIIVSDTWQEPRWTIFEETSWIRSYVGIPICLHDQALGILRLDAANPGEFSVEDVQRLQPLVNAAAIALENARLYDQARQELAERKQVEEKLEQSLSLLQATLESTADGIMVINMEGQVESFNQRYVEMWDIPPSFLSLKDPDEHLAFMTEQVKKPEEFLGRIWTLYERRDEESYDIIELKDGRVFERHGKPQRLGEKVVGRVWNLRDITERKRAEEALRESEERYRNLFENAPIGIYRKTPDGRILAANPAVLRMLDYTSLAELTTRSLEQNGHNPAHSHSSFQEILEREGEVKNLETIWLRRDHTPILISENARIVRDEEGNVLYYEGTVEDITERKRAQIEREKLIVELQEALAKVKTLRGLLPICASCKKIRDDQGYWTQVEVYIRNHSEVQFSHGVCPDCLKKLYPDFYEEDDE